MKSSRSAGHKSSNEDKQSNDSFDASIKTESLNAEGEEEEDDYNPGTPWLGASAATNNRISAQAKLQQSMKVNLKNTHTSVDAANFPAPN